MHEPAPQGPSGATAPQGSQRLLSYGLLAGILGGALLVSFLVTPADIETGRVILSTPCLTRTVLGIPCPSCGLTRAFCALSHGDFPAALAYNPLSPVMYGFFWIGALTGVAGLLTTWCSSRQRAR